MTETAQAVSTGHAIVHSLIEHGVDTVFGIPGVQTYELFDALAQHRDEIRVVGARHEQACAYMALGYAQATGRPGVCTVVPGPGILNAAAGLLTAVGTSQPVVCVTSEIPSTFIGRGMGHLHEMPDQLATLKTFAKWAENIDGPDGVPATLDAAFEQATTGRPGPVVVAAPWDVLTVTSNELPARAEPTARASVISTEALSEAAELIRAARNPMIMVGSGARGAQAQIQQLSVLLQAPVVSYRGGRGIVPDDSPYGFTCAEGFELWGETDLLVAIGTRQELVWFRWPDRPESLAVINIDIDPAQQSRLEPTVAVTGDSRDALVALLDLLGDLPRKPSRAAEYSAVKAAKQTELEATLQPHFDYLAAIRRAMPRDGYIVEEVSQIGFSSIFAFPIYESRHFITCGYQGNLGFGFPTALGVKVARPDNVVISITGDGGFTYGIQDLATAVQENIALITIVFNNGAFGNVKADQQRIYAEDYGSTLVNPDFVAVAKAFGADGHRASSPEELEGVLTRAIAANRPTVIEVEMPLDPTTSPWTFLMPASRRS